MYIADLNGIEYFCALRELYCYGNDLLTLNLSHNSNLEVLDCSYNDLLETLDVSGCPELTSLDCNYTSLQKLDVRNNAKLTRLVCFSTFLRTLNISNNPLLEELDTYDTRLANLDVSNNPNLGYLDCSENYMSSIDCVSGRDYTLLQDTTFTFEPQKTDPVTDSFTDEKFLDAVRDTIEKPDGDIYLTDLVEVTNLTVNNSGLTSLDGIEYMTALESIDCTSNYLTELDLYSNKSLTTVQCGDNELTNLDLSGNAELVTVDAYDNSLESINVSNSTNLASVNVSNNKLTELDLSSSNSLESLLCSENEISTNELKLPEYISSKLTDESLSSETPVSVDGFTFSFFPQVAINMNLQMSMEKADTVNISGSTVRNRPAQIYDITDCVFPAKFTNYLTNGSVNSIDTMSEADANELYALIVASGIPVGEEVSTGNGRLNESRTVSNLRDEYKFAFAITDSRGRKGTKIFELSGKLPHVTGLTFNNNKNSIVNVFESTNPLLKTYGLSGKKSTFIVTFDANADQIDKAYISVNRPYTGYAYAGDQNKDVELKKMPDGTFQASLLLKGGEVTLSNARAAGNIRVKCTLNTSVPALQGKQQVYFQPVRIVFDPSGYIYEGVPSNRLSDVRTTLYYLDKNGVSVEWDASEYDQANPILTDTNGVYEWFVPNGLWQVKAEREGYETVYTDWMRVPPERMDVNFGMISKEKPIIEQLCTYPDVIEINLNKYVYADDITAENITVYANGQQVQGSVRLVNAEVDYWEGTYDQEASGGTGNQYVSKIRFFPRSTLSLGTNVEVCLNESIRSYAGVNVDPDYSKSSVVVARPKSIGVSADSEIMSAGSNNTVFYGETSVLKMSLMPLEASKGKKLILTNDNPYALSVPTEVMVNDDGIAEIPMTGLALGQASITMTLEGSNLSDTVSVDIDLRN